ncbi:gamma carbonic anhydrase family protein [Pontiella sulfatireligans]|uniref:2,3,4,5-tetrahydropyridine-2,6-dicarboxylate N-acetyltransferase n=1 Tax=Pontiella sulfatireligans TaxID=2750658 RepID=A0A6C2UNI2_9BACT|nr:gamma carbonic anhydrase family protein [Pontiella sulfatireligans]VGO21825.1 2,3,4,5-tetrahydropyridine-2,6-dicarboxylate N-acetyltransferase [Pontiella sulfatireligans]
MIYQFEDRTPSLPEEFYVADSAAVIGSVVLGHQSSIWFGAVLRGDIEPITIGERSNIQDNSVAHTGKGKPVVIGDDVTVGHKVMLHACTVGSNCLIGMGAILLDGAVVGNNCIVGAGALVKQGQQIPDGSLAVGSPARVIRKLTEDEIDNVRSYATRYVALQTRYRSGGLKVII